MVEMHYEDTDSEPVVHWRIIVQDEDAALAQAAQDVAEGRNPIAVMARPASDPWDYAQPYRPREWKTLVGKSDLRRRTKSIPPAIGG